MHLSGAGSLAQAMVMCLPGIRYVRLFRVGGLALLRKQAPADRSSCHGTGLSTKCVGNSVDISATYSHKILVSPQKWPGLFVCLNCERPRRPVARINTIRRWPTGSCASRKALRASCCRRKQGTVVRVIPQERFSSEISLDPAMVSAFADSVGDTNPVHHDANFAAATRYQRPIASGTHTSALLLALTASHFSKTGAVVGLEFSCSFRRPVYADETIILEWLVVKVTPNAKLNGEIVDMTGCVKSQDGRIALEAKSRVLVTARPGE